MRHSRTWLLAGLCFTALAGCYRKVSENGGLVFSYEPWVPLVVVVGGLAVLLVGVVLLVRKQLFWGICLVIVGPLVLGVVAPGMYLD